MKKGHFFITEELGGPNKLVFRYMEVEKKSDCDLDVPQYPISLEIRPEAIVFYYKGPSHKSIVNSTEKDAQNTPNTNYVIFQLPLHNKFNDKFNLSNLIQIAFNEQVDINTDIFQYRNNPNRFLGANIPDNEKYVLIHYSNLELLSKFVCDDDPKGIFDFSDEHETEFNDQVLSKRKLLLDFLFDLEHSSVFDASPYKTSAVKSLQENEILDALVAKLEYYYVREQYFNSFNYYPTQKEVIAEWSRRLTLAEEHWVRIITSPNSEHLFSKTIGWFYEVEKELNGVFFNDHPKNGPIEVVFQEVASALKANINRSREKKHKRFRRFSWIDYHENEVEKLQNIKVQKFDSGDYESTYKAGLNFLLSRYDLIGAIKIFIHFHNLQFGVGFILLTLIGCVVSFFDPEIHTLIKYGFYSFSGVLIVVFLFYFMGIQIFPRLKFNFLSPIVFRVHFGLIAHRLSVVGIVVLFTLLLMVPSPHYSIYPFALLLIMGGFTLLRRVIYKKIIKPANILFKNVLFLSVVTFLLMIFLSGEFSPLKWLNFDLSFHDEIKFLFILGGCWVAGIPFIVVVLYIVKGWSLRVLYRYELLKKKKITKTPFPFGLLIPRVQIAIFSGWVILISTEELWKINFNASLFVVKSITIFGCFWMLYFIYNEIKEIAPSIEPLSILFRSGYLLFNCIIISVFVGVLTMGLVGQRMLMRSGILEYQFKDHIAESIARNTTSEALKIEVFLTRGETLPGINEIDQSEVREVASKYILPFIGQTLDILPLGAGLTENLIRPDDLKILETASQDVRDNKYACSGEMIEKMNAFKLSRAEFYFNFRDTLSILNDRDSLSDIEAKLLFNVKEEIVSDLINYTNHLDGITNKIRENLYINDDPRVYFERFVRIRKDVVFEWNVISNLISMLDISKDNGREQHSFYIFPRMLILNVVASIFLGIFIQLLTQRRRITARN